MKIQKNKPKLFGTYILRSFLYGEKAPGGMILIEFCSNRLEKNSNNIKIQNPSQMTIQSHHKIEGTDFSKEVCFCFLFRIIFILTNKVVSVFITKIKRFFSGK